jgi:hypothetical protein
MGHRVPLRDRHFLHRSISSPRIYSVTPLCSMTTIQSTAVAFREISAAPHHLNCVRQAAET